MSRRWTCATRITWWALTVSVLTTAATAAYLAAVYPSLPYGVPVRFERGFPLIYHVKTPLIVALPAVVQAGLLAVFGAVMMLLLWRARPASIDADASSDADSARMCLAAEGIAMLSAVWIAVQAFGAVRLVVLWRRGVGGYGDAYSFAILTAIVASVVIAARTMKLVGDKRQSSVAVDPTMWRLTSLYFNASDPALFVPTRTGAGWTLNFGRPLAIVLLVGTLIIGIGGPYVFARYVLRGFGN